MFYLRIHLIRIKNNSTITISQDGEQWFLGRGEKKITKMYYKDL
jgi:hypothetical protein